MRRCKPTIRTTLLAITLAFGFLAAGCDRKPQAQPKPQVPEVATITIKPCKVVLSTELPGRTSACRIAEIRPQINGIILKRLFTEGADVKAGQILYQIDPAPLEAVLSTALAAQKRAEANLPAVRSQSKRFKQALAEKAVSQQDYENAVAVLKQAEADLQYSQATVETARINLGYCKVTAPISGRIGRSSVTEGAIVTAYQPLSLATIQQLDPIYVDVPQSTTELLCLKKRLKEGRLDQNGADQNSVKLIMEDGGAYPWEGQLQFSDITVDPTTGSVNVRAIFPNPEGTLLPGMFVRTMIKEGMDERAILVPQQGISRDRRGNPFVLSVNAESKAELKPLVLDRAIEDQWLVSKGLVPGDRVIVAGLKRLRPGTVVKAVPFHEKQTAQGPATDFKGQPLPKNKEGA